MIDLNSDCPWKARSQKMVPSGWLNLPPRLLVAQRLWQAKGYATVYTLRHLYLKGNSLLTSHTSTNNRAFKAPC